MLFFIFGMPVVVGNMRANSANEIEDPPPRVSSYMDEMNYIQALEGGEIVNCFVWEEISTMYKIEAPEVK